MQNLVLKNKGLYTFVNDLSDAPPGSMKEAKNVIIDRDDIVETRRGFKNCQEITGVDALFNYKQRVFLHADGKLYLDNEDCETLTEVGDLVSDCPIFGTIANQNLYLTSNDGVKVLSDIVGNLTDAGVPPAIDGSLAEQAVVGDPVVTTGNEIAYRVVWGKRDANGTEVLGAPSGRMTLTATVDTDIEITFPIPDTITTDFFYQIYRSLNINDTSDDELFLIYENRPSNAEITAGEITYLDNGNETGATLYTSPSQQGIAASNFQPPFAKDVVTFNDMTFYLDNKSRQSLVLTLNVSEQSQFGNFLTTGTLTMGQTVIVGADTTNARVGQTVVDTATMDELGTIIALTATTISLSQLYTGAGATNFELVDSVVVDGNIFIGNNTGDPFTFEPTADIETTAINLVNAINRDLTDISAYYLGVGDEGLGTIRLQANELSKESFEVSASFDDAFTPSLPQTSSDNAAGVAVSKVGQPESVPFGNYFNVGDPTFPILRGVALRDALYILKKDGIYRITGFTPETLATRRFDDLGTLRGVRNVGVLNNQIFAFTDQGVIAISPNGITVVSRSIERDLLALSKDRNANFDNLSFAVTYESDRKYILWTIKKQSDTFARQAFVFNALTKTWVRWEYDATAGVVNCENDRLYVGTPSGLSIERKDYQFSDYVDDEMAVNIVAVNGKTLTLDQPVPENWSILQANDTIDDFDENLSEIVYEEGDDIDQYEYDLTDEDYSYQNELNFAQIVSVDGNAVTFDKDVNFVVGAATALQPIEQRVVYWPLTGGNPGIYKRFKDMTFLFEDSNFEKCTISFYNEATSNASSVDLHPKHHVGLGYKPFGLAPMGGNIRKVQNLRTYVSREQCRSFMLTVRYDHNEAYTLCALKGLSYMFENLTQRFR